MPVTPLAARLRLADPDPSPPEVADGTIPRLLRIADLCDILGCDRRTLERMRSAGTLPRPTLHVGTRSPRWTQAMISSWIERGGGHE
jgi:predicted DNA-binding transcriptional regulator AlpA